MSLTLEIFRVINVIMRDEGRQRGLSTKEIAARFSLPEEGVLSILQTIYDFKGWQGASPIFLVRELNGTNEFLWEIGETAKLFFLEDETNRIAAEQMKPLIEKCDEVIKTTLTLTDDVMQLKPKLPIIEDAELEEFFDDKKFIPKLLGDYILERKKIKTLIGSGEMYYYKDGLYRQNGKEYLREICAFLLKESFRTNCLSETLAYIQAVTYVDPKTVNGGWVNLENGLLNPLTREFKPHTPDIFSIVRIPIKYDPNATCPLWEKSLHERVPEEIYQTVQEMFGYCYLTGQKYEKAFLLVGQKRTFKSTTLKMLEELQGRENMSAEQLQTLSDDQFAMAYLYGKTLNVCADISSRALKDTGTFLTITGGDPITAGKKHQDRITFYPSAKLVFSCNVVPASPNKHPAFYRRWIPLKFDIQTPKDKVDYSFADKLKAELSGILNWALEGLDRLEKQGHFTYNPTEDEIKDIYERSSDTTQSFIFNEIDTENDEGALTKRETYARYLEFCKENDLQPVNVVAFGRLFLALTGCGTCKKGRSENVLPAYKGVSFKTKTDDSKKNLAKYKSESSNETPPETLADHEATEEAVDDTSMF